jgi:hypothetical protein
MKASIRPVAERGTQRGAAHLQAGAKHGQPASLRLQHSSRMVAQRARIQAAFGAAALRDQAPRSLAQPVTSSEPLAQLKNCIPMKDEGPARRSNGSGPDLSNAVNAIASNKLVDMEDTASALRLSIQHRQDAPVVGVEAVPGGHAARIALEQQLLAQLETAIAQCKADREQVRKEKEQASLSKLPDVVPPRGPTGGAWGK